MQDKSVDPVSMQVVNGFLTTTAREMGIAMKNTSYSPLFNEGLDFSCAIFDEEGGMIAQADFCPAHLGAIIFVAEWTIRELGIENFQPGDVILHNDPFRGGCHLPEFAVIKPVFFNSELVAFLCNIGHMTEVGGKVPGGFPSDATEVFQEGIRIPPVKIMKHGKNNEDVWNIILANVRTPRFSYGDLRAMIGSLEVGELKIAQMLQKYGLSYFRHVKEHIKDYSEKRMRAEIAEIPDGVYNCEDYIADHDGVLDKPVKIRAKITVEKDSITFDYTGSDPQAEGPINCTYGVTASATYNALLSITSSDIPVNLGCFRPVRIIVPPGSVLNVEYPGASVGGNADTYPHIITVLYKALSQVLPLKVAASDGGICGLLGMGGQHPESGKTYTYLHIDAVGWGGRATKDGNSALGLPNGNAVLTPVEVLETKYPLLHHVFSLRSNSGGAGKYRGGLGCVREFEIRADTVRLSAFLDRMKLPPGGLLGGKPGKKTVLLVKKEGQSEFQSFKEAYSVRFEGKFSDIRLNKGDIVRLLTPGGGGYGDSLERDLKKVETDVEEGYITVQEAQENYKVVFRPRTHVIDYQRSKRLRENLIGDKQKEIHYV